MSFASGSSSSASTAVHRFRGFSNAVWFTPTPRMKDRWPPMPAVPATSPAPPSASNLPSPRQPAFRDSHESLNSPTTPTLPSACAVASRFGLPSVSASSFHPDAIVGTAHRRPNTISRSAAFRDRSPPNVSRKTALNNDPTVAAVSGGCSAWPNHVPDRKSFSGPGFTAPSNHVVSCSAIGSSSSIASNRSATCCNGDCTVIPSVSVLSATFVRSAASRTLPQVDTPSPNGYHGRTFALTDRQRRLLEGTRRLGADVLAPIAERAVPGRVDRELLKALAEHGILPSLFPERFGGTAPRDVSAFDLCLYREALAQGSVEAETALAMQGLGGYPILQSARRDLARKWVPKIAAGEAVAAFALTEPEHGSDAAAIETRAEAAGSGYRLTGEKTWISNAPDADVYVLFARTTPGVGSKGVTAFVVPGDAPKLSGEPLDLLSPHPIGRMTLDGVHVPSGHVLGKVDAGFKVAMRTLDLFRPSVGAFAVGMAQAALDAAVAHAGARRSFDRPLREHQAVSQALGEMATRTEAARLLVYAAAARYDADAKDPGVTRASAMAKLFATETAQYVVDAAVQIHGAAGLQRGHLLERLYREVRAPRIYEGTTEIQREVVARDLYRKAP